MTNVLGFFHSTATVTDINRGRLNPMYLWSPCSVRGIPSIAPIRETLLACHLEAAFDWWGLIRWHLLIARDEACSFYKWKKTFLTF